MRRRVAWALVILVHGAVLAADWLAPYDVDDVARDLAYAPPTAIHVTSEAGVCCTAPWVAAWIADDEPDGRLRYRVDANAGRGYLALRPTVSDARGVERRPLLAVSAPHRLMLLGADGYGRDLWSRLLHAARISLSLGLMATVLSLSIAAGLGITMAVGPRAVRSLIGAVADGMLVLPWIYLLLGFRALLPLSMPGAWTAAATVGVLVAAGWARPARVIASEAHTIVGSAFVDAARASGATTRRLLWHHVLPHTWTVLTAQGLVMLPQFVLAEVTLSFLGLGLGEPTPSLGNLLMPLREPGVLTTYWWMAAPAAALVALLALYQSCARAAMSGDHA